MDCVIAIDQGTQSTRAFLYDSNAKAFASHQEEFNQIYPQQGYAQSQRSVLDHFGSHFWYYSVFFSGGLSTIPTFFWTVC
jgi:hypothetical protein